MGSVSREAVSEVAFYASDWLEYQRKVQHKVGIQAAIYLDNEIVYSDAVGYADLETKDPLRTDHLMRVASHSKWFTATAIMQLVDLGNLQLDDPIGKYIEWIRDERTYGNKKDLTVRELLSHGSGLIRSSHDIDYFQVMIPVFDVAGLGEQLKGHTSILPSSTRLKYSNMGYALLGEVIEAASGVTYAEFMQRAIFDPLSLKRTGVDYAPELKDQFARAYSSLDYETEKRIPTELQPFNAMVPAGGFYSTAEEMCRFAATHFMGNEELISDRAKRQMHKIEWPFGKIDPTKYGLGVFIIEIDGRRMIGHSGGIPSYITYTLCDPEERLAVSVLTNTIDRGAYGFVDGIVKLINIASKSGPAPTNNPPDLSRYCGRFESLWGVFDFVKLGTRLLRVDPKVPDPTSDPAQFTFIGGDSFILETTEGTEPVGETVDFKFLPNGTVERVRIGGASYFPPEEYRKRFVEVDEIRLPKTWH